MTKAVLFDLDGTLLNTGKGIIHSVDHTIKKMGYRKISEDELPKFVGPPIQDSLAKYCNIDAEEAQRGANEFRTFYKEEALYEAELYDGIIDLLNELKQGGIRIGVATYKREDYALDLLAKFGILDYCDVAHGADNNNKLTKADIVELCIKEMGIGNEEVVLVGDTKHDARGAEMAGVRFIGVTWGFGYKDINTIPNHPIVVMVAQPCQILEYINQ